VKKLEINQHTKEVQMIEDEDVYKMLFGEDVEEDEEKLNLNLLDDGIIEDVDRYLEDGAVDDGIDHFV
jgi:hypothetical protein